MADDLFAADISIRAGNQHPLQPPLRRDRQKKPQHFGAVAPFLLAYPDRVADVSAPDGEHRMVNVVAQVDDAHHLPVGFPFGKINMGGNLSGAVFLFFTKADLFDPVLRGSGFLKSRAAVDGHTRRQHFSPVGPDFLGIG